MLIIEVNNDEFIQIVFTYYRLLKYLSIVLHKNISSEEVKYYNHYNTMLNFMLMSQTSIPA